MNYKIIRDEVKLKEFIEWLPKLEPNERFYVTLLARRKYDKGIPADKAQLKRFVAHKGNLYDKIKQLECEVGCYKFKGAPISQDSLVLYISPSPRDLEKATVMLGKACFDLTSSKKHMNIQSEALTCIQQSKRRTVVLDFDIDTKDLDITKLSSILPIGSYQAVETRGGYHVLVYVNKQVSKLWYKSLLRFAKDEGFEIDQTGDQLLPVPGATQGGFTPKMINYGN